MRATRAYIAGFGTAGSLVAGAALVFVTASAVVAFRGWPQVATSAAPAAVVVSHTHVGGPSRADRRLTVAAAAVPVSHSTSSPGTHPASGPNGSPGTARASAGIAVASTPLGATHVTPVTVSPPGGGTSTPAGCSSNCSPSGPVNVTTTVQDTTGQVGTGVTGAGKSLGAAINGVAGAVASKLSGVSPGVANTVSQAGSTLGSTVTGATSAAGQIVTGAGNTLGNLLGHH
jgi:hypothetical protein